MIRTGGAVISHQNKYIQSSSGASRTAPWESASPLVGLFRWRCRVQMQHNRADSNEDWHGVTWVVLGNQLKLI